VLSRDLSRNETVVGADVEQRYQWMSPLQASLHCSAEHAIGRLAAKPLRAGTPLKTKHVRRETLVERGDRVNVRCLVGGVAIALQAEARSSGSEGDVIELRKPGERISFSATVVGRGEAVLNLNDSRRES
jgi:flagella basal body P-ring formation protein FlgA